MRVRARARMVVTATALMMWQVESVYFDPGTCLIRIKGRTVEENKHVKVSEQARARAHDRTCPRAASAGRWAPTTRLTWK